MKQILFINTIVNVIEYTLVYLIRSFVIWKFTNPIQWIINIPTYDSGDRAALLLGIFCWQAFQIFVIYNILRDIKTK